MKWLLVLVICLISCRENDRENSQSNDADTPAQQAPIEDASVNTPVNAPSSSPRQNMAERLIIPGERVGKVRLGDDDASLEALLGTPDVSNAAMGKAWLTWHGKRDEHNNRTELNIYTTYQDSSMKRKTVQQIRTTSSYFHTADSLRVYASLDEIRKQFPGIGKRAQYNDEGRTIIIYDDLRKGIAFEIVSANTQEICIGIIVHKKGENVTNVYRFLHPDLRHF